MNKSRSRKVNRIQTAPLKPEWNKESNTTAQRAECPYNIEQFETFENVARRGRARHGAYLVFKRKIRNSSDIDARLSLPPDVVSKMHACMDFEDYLEYRVSKSARAIALIPGPHGVKLSSPSDHKGIRCSMSMNRASEILLDMFGDSHYVYLMAEYYDGVTILRPTGETEGTLGPEADRCR